MAALSDDPPPGDETATFLAAIWGHGPHSLNRMPPGEALDFRIVDDYELILQAMPTLQDAHIWIGAHALKGHPPKGSRGNRDDVAEVVAIPADLDWDDPIAHKDTDLPSESEVRTALSKLNHDLEPSIVVNSGHGLQVWWLLRIPISPDEAEALIDQIELKLNEVGLTNGRRDLASILRLPGTRNLKDLDDIAVVFIEKMDTEIRHMPERLRAILPKATGTIARKGKATRHHLGAVTDQQQELANYIISNLGGHSPYVQRDGSIHLVRPGKTPREGFGANIIVGDDGDAIATNFSDHWPEWDPGSYVLSEGKLVHPSSTQALLGGITILPTTSPELVVDSQPVDIFIDWREFAKRDSSQHRWLVEKFWPWGRGMALWAGAKEGKSELILWCAGCMAMGRHPWTGQPIEPIQVAYFDYEMTEDDLEERLSDFGFDLDDLDNLHYALFPPLYPLDVEQGGIQITDYCKGVGAQAVILDTFSRVVKGEENEADTVRDFYRHTGIRLKQAGIGYLRLDHAGKDSAKGQRGTSAKRDDVDVVWRQQRTQTGVSLNCTGMSRLSWVGPVLDVDRDVNVRNGEVSYSAPIQIGVPSGTAEKVAELDKAGVPEDAGRPAAIAALKAAGIKPGRIEVLAAAIKYRRERPKSLGTGAGNSSPEQFSGTAGEQGPDDSLDLFSDQEFPDGNS